MRALETIAAEYATARKHAIELRNELAERLDAVIVQAVNACLGDNNDVEDFLQEVRLHLLWKLWREDIGNVNDLKAFAYRVAERSVWETRYKPVLATPSANDVQEQNIVEYAYECLGDPTEKPRDRSVNGIKRRRQSTPDDVYTPSPEDRDELRKAVLTLSPILRRIMVLHLAGKSNQEIAQTLNKPEHSVRGQLSDARKQLRAKLNPTAEAA